MRLGLVVKNGFGAHEYLAAVFALFGAAFGHGNREGVAAGAVGTPAEHGNIIGVAIFFNHAAIGGSEGEVDVDASVVALGKEAVVFACGELHLVAAILLFGGTAVKQMNLAGLGIFSTHDVTVYFLDFGNPWDAFKGLDAVGAAGGGFAFGYVGGKGVGTAGCNSTAVDNGVLAAVVICFDGFAVAIGQLEVDALALKVAVGKECIGFAGLESDSVVFAAVLCQIAVEWLEFSRIANSLTHDFTVDSLCCGQPVIGLCGCGEGRGSSHQSGDGGESKFLHGMLLLVKKVIRGKQRADYSQCAWG